MLRLCFIVATVGLVGVVGGRSVDVGESGMSGGIVVYVVDW